MGSSIGQISASIVAARRESPVADSATRPEVSFQQSASKVVNSGTQSAGAIAPPQAGFGPGTVSGPAAALVTLGRGVAAAREAVPTLEELRAQFQTNRAARNAESDSQSEAFRNRDTERGEELGPRIPGADPLAFSRFSQTLGFSQPESEVAPPELASARPPEAPEFATAPEIDRPDAASSEAATNSVVPDFVQRRRLDLTA